MEYPFPKKLNYKYSAGVVDNMIVPVVKLTDSDFNSYSATDSITQDTTETIRKYVKLKLPGQCVQFFLKMDI